MAVVITRAERGDVIAAVGQKTPGRAGVSGLAVAAVVVGQAARGDLDTAVTGEAPSEAIIAQATAGYAVVTVGA